ncbi:Probable endonuclease 4, partial [Geodia barretti]
WVPTCRSAAACRAPSTAPRQPAASRCRSSRNHRTNGGRGRSRRRRSPRFARGRRRRDRTDRRAHQLPDQPRRGQSGAARAFGLGACGGARRADLLGLLGVVSIRARTRPVRKGRYPLHRRRHRRGAVAPDGRQPAAAGAHRGPGHHARLPLRATPGDDRPAGRSFTGGHLPRHLPPAGGRLRHRFGSGFYAQVFEEFDAILGLDLLKVFHLNDSKKPLGSRVDRHDGIGRGCIGVEPFRRLLQDARFRHLPMVLETPKANGGGADEIAADALDLENLAILKRFRDEV